MKLNKRLFLTLYSNGRALPDGFVGRVRSVEDGGVSMTKLDLLCIALDTMGLEVGFSASRPIGRESPEDGYLPIDAEDKNGRAH